MYDSRLIGTWRSDARKTRLEIAARRDLTAAQKRKLTRFFGRLELRYTRTHCYSTLGQYVSVSPYKVVAKDSSSVAVVVSNAIAGKQIVHVHFEGSRYWIVLGSGQMREFFKRVEPKTGKRKAKRRS